ncbi:hypothetical protein Esti_005227 [Eimeria stiedai]
MQTVEVGFASSAADSSGLRPPQVPLVPSLSRDFPATHNCRKAVLCLQPTVSCCFENREASASTSSDADSAKKADVPDDEVERPVVSKDAVVRYMDQTELENFLQQHNLTAAQYSEGVSFSIGEGGRELLRAALFHYTDGRTLQGASVPQLLKHAFALGLWPLAQRIRAERSAGILTDLHLAFSNFKSAQSRRRRRSSTALMHAVRDAGGRILSIIYDPNKTLPIGLQGRVRLKLLIAKRMEKNPNKAAALLIEHGLDGVRLREATVAELLAIAWVLGLWGSVEEIVRGNEHRKRSLLAKRASSAHAAGCTSSSNLEELPKRQCKRRCAQPQSSAESQGPTPAPCLASSGPSAAGCTAKAEVLAVTSLEASPPSTVVHSQSARLKASASRIRLPADAQDVPAPIAEQGDTVQPCNADLLADGIMANDTAATQCTHPGDPYTHLERIGQLVACANPAAPNAKAVAADVVKELLALVQKGVLPDPPKEILIQLQTAAIRLGVHDAPSHAPQVCGQPAEPAG